MTTGMLPWVQQLPSVLLLAITIGMLMVRTLGRTIPAVTLKPLHTLVPLSYNETAVDHQLDMLTLVFKIFLPSRL